MTFRQSGRFLSMLRQTYEKTTTWLVTSYTSHNGCHLPRTKPLKIKALKEKMVQLHTQTLISQQSQQVGAYRTAVYTTKIILALARVSKQQSQPFMVRVEIYIAESRAGKQVNPRSGTHLWVQVSVNAH